MDNIKLGINEQRRHFFGSSIGLSLVGAGLATGVISTSASAANGKKHNPAMNYPANQLEHVTQTLVTPPFVPKHDQVAKGKPKVIDVTLTIEEKQVELERGVKAWISTFNGSVPGPLIICHQYDYIELTLQNPKTNLLSHNIDLHAATGALGGGELTLVSPGEEVTFRFKATKVGTFVYHCAPGGIMTPWHVAMGMAGAIMVLPRDGLTDGYGNPIRYDKAYYVGEQDFYVPTDKNGKYKNYDTVTGSMSDTLEVMKTLTPSHVVFNGKVAALTGQHAMKANVGETVMFIHSQPNRDTRPHIIGGHGDYVWPTGSFNDTPLTDLETWAIPGGSTGAAIYTFLQPGLYAYVNHNLIEAIMKGAAAHIKVEGEWDNNLMVQLKKPHKMQ